MLLAINDHLSKTGGYFFLQKIGIGLLIALIVYIQGGEEMPRPNARVKSVHFNITVEEDAKILQAIGRRNFSKYVKELILEDIKKNEQPKPSIQKGGIKYLPKQS